jgi:hypothetical protein
VEVNCGLQDPAVQTWVIEEWHPRAFDCRGTFRMRETEACGAISGVASWWDRQLASFLHAITCNHRHVTAIYRHATVTSSLNWHQTTSIDRNTIVPTYRIFINLQKLKSNEMREWLCTRLKIKKPVSPIRSNFLQPSIALINNTSLVTCVMQRRLVGRFEINGEGCIRKESWPILIYFPDNLLKMSEKNNWKNLFRRQGQDLNPESPRRSANYSVSTFVA